MADDRFDAIIVGGGPAGSTAAYVLAKAGLEVLIVERGTYAGSKNLSGAVLYSHALGGIFEDYTDQAPLERAITVNEALFLTPEQSFGMTYHNPGFAQTPANAFSVLRANFDTWLFDQAENAGAACVAGIKVSGVLKKDGKITGIIADDEEMEADVIIAADGALSFIAQSAGLRGPIESSMTAVGVKELIYLPSEKIEDRFGLEPEEGKAYAIVGAATAGIPGGGFLYTNKESLSIGLVLHLNHLAKTGLTPTDVLDDFLDHPSIKPLIAGGTLEEYGAHLVLEGGLAGMSQLYADNILVAGDAAGFGVNAGLTVRGIDLAIGSGIAAAETVIEAKQKQDYSAATLAAYKTRLESSFVMKDMNLYKNSAEFMANPLLYTQIPGFLTSFMQEVYAQDGSENLHLMKYAQTAMKDNGVSLLDLAKLGLKGVRSL